MSNIIRLKRLNCSCCGGRLKIRKEVKKSDGVICHRCLSALTGLSEQLVYQMKLSHRIGQTGEVGELILVNGIYYVGQHQPSSMSMAKQTCLF